MAPLGAPVKEAILLQRKYQKRCPSLYGDTLKPQFGHGSLPSSCSLPTLPLTRVLSDLSVRPKTSSSSSTALVASGIEKENNHRASIRTPPAPSKKSIWLASEDIQNDVSEGQKLPGSAAITAATRTVFGKAKTEGAKSAPLSDGPSHDPFGLAYSAFDKAQRKVKSLFQPDIDLSQHKDSDDAQGAIKAQGQEATKGQHSKFGPSLLERVAFTKDLPEDLREDSLLRLEKARALVWAEEQAKTRKRRAEARRQRKEEKRSTFLNPDMMYGEKVQKPEKGSDSEDSKGDGEEEEAEPEEYGRSHMQRNALPMYGEQVDVMHNQDQDNETKIKRAKMVFVVEPVKQETPQSIMKTKHGSMFAPAQKEISDEDLRQLRFSEEDEIAAESDEEIEQEPEEDDDALECALAVIEALIGDLDDVAEDREKLVMSFLEDQRKKMLVEPEGPKARASVWERGMMSTPLTKENQVEDLRGTALQTTISVWWRDLCNNHRGMAFEMLDKIIHTNTVNVETKGKLMPTHERLKTELAGDRSEAVVTEDIEETHGQEEETNEEEQSDDDDISSEDSSDEEESDDNNDANDDNDEPSTVSQALRKYNKKWNLKAADSGTYSETIGVYGPKKNKKQDTMAFGMKASNERLKRERKERSIEKEEKRRKEEAERMKKFTEWRAKHRFLAFSIDPRVTSYWVGVEVNKDDDVFVKRFADLYVKFMQANFFPRGLPKPGAKKADSTAAVAIAEHMAALHNRKVKEDHLKKTNKEEQQKNLPGVVKLLLDTQKKQQEREEEMKKQEQKKKKEDMHWKMVSHKLQNFANVGDDLAPDLLQTMMFRKRDENNPQIPVKSTEQMAKLNSRKSHRVTQIGGDIMFSNPTNRQTTVVNRLLNPGAHSRQTLVQHPVGSPRVGSPRLQSRQRAPPLLFVDQEDMSDQGRRSSTASGRPTEVLSKEELKRRGTTLGGILQVPPLQKNTTALLRTPSRQTVKIASPRAGELSDKENEVANANARPVSRPTVLRPTNEDAQRLLDRKSILMRHRDTELVEFLEARRSLRPVSPPETEESDDEKPMMTSAGLHSAVTSAGLHSAVNNGDNQPTMTSGQTGLKAALLHRPELPAPEKPAFSKSSSDTSALNRKPAKPKVKMLIRETTGGHEHADDDESAERSRRHGLFAFLKKTDQSKLHAFDEPKVDEQIYDHEAEALTRSRRLALKYEKDHAAVRSSRGVESSLRRTLRATIKMEPLEEE